MLLPPAPETVIVQFSAPALENDSGSDPPAGFTVDDTAVGPEHESIALVASVLLQESVLLWPVVIGPRGFQYKAHIGTLGIFAVGTISKLSTAVAVPPGPVAVQVQ